MSDNNKNILFQYIKNVKNQKIGIFLAIKVNDEISIGFSLCHSKIDKFDFTKGMEIATGRAMTKYSIIIGSKNNYDDDFDYNDKLFNALYIPNSIESQLNRFLKRSLKYFKNIKMDAAWQTYLIHG